MRKGGVLLPVSSIPSKYGIGTFSKQAYEFVDFLERAGQSFWQILPLGPTGYGDSPYQSFSTFAGNPYYIDLEELIKKGWLTKEECDACDFGSDDGYVDYEKIYLSRFRILKIAYERSNIKEDKEFGEFKEDNAAWLEDYALYMAVKNSFHGISWIEWEEDIRLRKPEAMKAYKEKFADEIEFYQFQQFVFAVQWLALKAYANKKKISIIGDIPIYVAFDSADTWANPELFQLDESCTPTGVAGCPPDSFSATGQLWGNPLYKWEYHKETGYEWWMQRISYCYRLYDVVRIDHFRGFDEYYFIPYGDTTAEFGHWEKGPGYDIFKVMKEKIGKKPVIAEDLGFLTPSVISLVKKTGYPGMKILQFAFDSREESDYLPHNYSNNSVVYTGTHDNDTTMGWYGSLNRQDKAFAKRYLNIKAKKEIYWEFIRAALSSVADTAIIPVQDYLGLGSEARVNMPSTLGNNWKWRLRDGQLDDSLAERIREITKLYGRI
ncbi:MAG: 4-alpha-glucanotransferase [Lachnospiraceae bacterium]|jgi:4-alpha-glucanotransferase|nr:4-alpha-glucanotransferase [Lachnospiraceae bacterium 28-4]MCI8845258.1 4-alpha-glucanotransferase [Lachnospiraceae bacterium]